MKVVYQLRMKFEVNKLLLSDMSLYIPQKKATMVILLLLIHVVKSREEIYLVGSYNFITYFKITVEYHFSI